MSENPIAELRDQSEATQKITLEILARECDYRRRLTRAESIVRIAVRRGGALGHDEWLALLAEVSAPVMYEPTPKPKWTQRRRRVPLPLPPQDETRTPGRAGQGFRA